MSQKIQVLLVDDLDGGVAEETVSFGLDGDDYEIDLSCEHAAALRAGLQDYLGAARRVNRRRAAGKRSSAGGPDTAAVRAWARDNGISVSARGRVSAEVVAQYEAANS
ncbi:MAG: Lsr2 family protein [Actinomycetes bacterium]